MIFVPRGGGEPKQNENQSRVTLLYADNIAIGFYVESSFLCIFNIFYDCWWSTKMAKGLWKSLHPLSSIQSRQTVRKGEQSPFIYVGHFFFFLTLWPICIASLSIFHTLLHLPNTFLRPILYNAMIQTYVRVSPSFLLPACHCKAFCIVPDLLNCTMSPQLCTSII